MARAATSKPRTDAAPAPSIAVVGAGLAGLTAALRLSRCGFKVTLYEATDTLGGNTSSLEVNGVYHDVYPHMFCAWYLNFWHLFEKDLGLSRDGNFSPRMGVKLQKKGSPVLHELENATTLRSIFANLTSGVLTPPEMFLLGFSMLDLASHAFNRDGSDETYRLDVNGFIYSRGYATESVARLQNYILMVIWSIQSDSTAATSYQDFIKNTVTFPHPTPFAWMLEGSLEEKIIRPLSRQLDCQVRTNSPVSTVAIVDGKPRLTIASQAGPDGDQAPEVVDTDYVVLAVPGAALAKLVMTGEPGQRIVDREPRLTGLQHSRAVAIPVVDVYFQKKKKFPQIPLEQVGFMDSDFDLTILDISQLWTNDPNMKDRTALAIAASNADAIPSLDPLERGFMMIQQLHDRLPIFSPGEYWGDPKSDIDWDMTHYRSNDDRQLFVNTVGSWLWRPQASYSTLPRIFFAGDLCQTDVDMATVEAAVQSGLLAAQALQIADAGKGRRRGDPIKVLDHTVYGGSTFLAGKLALLPAAYAAAAWSVVVDALRRGIILDLPPDAYSRASAALLLPLTFTEDWCETAYLLAKTLLSENAKTGTPAPALEKEIPLSTTLVDLGAQALIGLGDMLQDISSRQPSRGQAQAGSNIGAALSAFAGQVLRTTVAAFEAGARTRTDPDGSPTMRGHRRARVKL